MAHPKRKPLPGAEDPLGLVALIGEHCEWMMTHNYSARTVEGRGKSLSYFAGWCMERGITRPTEVTRQILESYQRYLFYHRKEDGSPLSITTQQSRLVPVKTFFKWLVRQNHLALNPAGELEMPRSPYRLPKHILSHPETENILSQADIGDVYGLRDRAILETLYSTGLRRMEIANLKIYDIDFSRGLVMVRCGKGGKDRCVPIGERAMAWIRKYLEQSRPKLVCGADEGALFLAQSGNGFTPGSISALARKYILLGAPGKSGSAHLFRHTMATLMLDNGADIRYVQEMLGHVKLSTTQIYTHVAIGKLKEIHEATHPAKFEGPERLEPEPA